MSDEPVHSAISPSCMDDWPSMHVVPMRQIGYHQDDVTCTACLHKWARRGMPKYIIRRGESNADFLKRTGLG